MCYALHDCCVCMSNNRRLSSKGGGAVTNKPNDSSSSSNSNTLPPLFNAQSTRGSNGPMAVNYFKFLPGGDDNYSKLKRGLAS
jgi:hypothetical protein